MARRQRRRAYKECPASAALDAGLLQPSDLGSDWTAGPHLAHEEIPDLTDYRAMGVTEGAEVMFNEGGFGAGDSTAMVAENLYAFANVSLASTAFREPDRIAVPGTEDTVGSRTWQNIGGVRVAIWQAGSDLGEVAFRIGTHGWFLNLASYTEPVTPDQVRQLAAAAVFRARRLA